MKSTFIALMALFMSATALINTSIYTASLTPPVHVSKALLDARDENQPELPDDFARTAEHAEAEVEEIFGCQCGGDCKCDPCECEGCDCKDTPATEGPTSLQRILNTMAEHAEKYNAAKAEEAAEIAEMERIAEEIASRPPVTATWEEVEPIMAVAADPAATLPRVDFHTDSVRCAYCRQTKTAFKERGLPGFSFQTHDYKDSQWPKGMGLPTWIIKMPDGRTFTREGYADATILNRWYKKMTGLDPQLDPEPVEPVATVPGKMIVTLSNTTPENATDATVAALAEHLRRSNPRAVGATDDEEFHVSGGLLPAMPVDVPDFVVAMLQAVNSPEGYQAGGFNAKWAGGSIRMEPAFELKFKKFLTIKAGLTCIQVTDTSEITFLLDGALDLTVRLR